MITLPVAVDRYLLPNLEQATTYDLLMDHIQAAYESATNDPADIADAVYHNFVTLLDNLRVDAQDLRDCDLGMIRKFIKYAIMFA